MYFFLQIKKMKPAKQILIDQTKREIYYTFGCLGLSIVEHFDDENAHTFFLPNSGWRKVWRYR